MYIVYLLYEFPDVSETFVLDQITGIIKRGLNVEIIAYKKGNSSLMSNIIIEYDVLAKTKYVYNIPKSKFNRFFEGIYCKSKKYIIKLFCLLNSLKVGNCGKEALNLNFPYELIQYISNNQCDIIHCQFGHLWPIAIKMKQLGFFNAKVVTSFRGYDLSGYLKMNGSEVYRELFDKGDLFLPVSEKFRDRLIHYGCDEKKIIVHRSGIDINKFKYYARIPNDNGSIKLLSIGRLVEKKGFEFSIRAIAKVIENNDLEINYIIVGDGPLKDHLNNLVNQLGAQNFIRLEGAKKHSEVVDFINNSHILIAPSITASDGDEEGIPTVLKEAMASGMPAISTYHAGIAELVLDSISGYLVPEKDTRTLEMRIQYLIDHPELWPKMGRAGRKYVEEHYDVNKLNDELHNIYRNLLNS